MDWYRQAVYSVNDYNASEDAENLTCPVLILHGRNDETVDLKEMEKSSKKYFTNYKFTILEDGTHAIAYEKAEEVTALIRDFIEND